MMKQLSSADAFFVYSEGKRTPMHIGGLSLYDASTVPSGSVNFRDIRNFIALRLKSIRAFRQRLVRVPFDLDYPYWIEDAEVDLDRHLRRVNLPRPGGWAELRSEVCRIHALPLDMTRPLWEFVVIEGLGPDRGLPANGFALVWKVHHALIDGAGGTAMSTLLHDRDATMTRVLPVEEPQAEPQPWAGNLMMRSYLHALARPVRNLGILGRAAPGLARLARGRLHRKPSMEPRPPRTRFNAPVTARRVWDGVAFQIDELRRIERTVGGATINDVVLAIVGGALRTYLQAKGELPAEPLRAMVPISIRRKDDHGQAGNHVSAMLVNLGTHIADSRERLRYVHQAANAGKEAHGEAGEESLASLFELLPPALSAVLEKHYAELGTGNEHRTLINCVVTNVPGSREPLYFAGASLVAMYGIGPIFDGLGLMNIASSYGQALTLSFTSDPAMMPDPSGYAGALRSSFCELLRTADMPPG